MAKIISVIVSGNPDSNSGFNKLILFNNPNFDIADPVYSGFEACPHFYTIQMTPTHTIFKLVKNNVRSLGAVRPGRLAIAFSIPKNHKLDNGYTPYDVLEDLKKVFIAKCMTCRDSVSETYEFNSPIIDQTILDQTAAKYTASPMPLPKRVMNPNGPVGYVVKSDEDLSLLFRDFYYPEFDKFSEVVIAEAVNQTPYISIPNLSVPRVKVYDVYVDGVRQESVSTDEQVVTITPKRVSEYFDYTPLTFCLRDLKEGMVPGVELLDSLERINVSTKGLVTPKKIEYQIKFQNPEITKYFLEHSGLIELRSPRGNLPITNLRFTLLGESNADVRNNNITVRIQGGSKYVYTSSRFEGNVLYVSVKNASNGGGAAGGRKVNSSLYAVKIHLNSNFKFDDSRRTINIRLSVNGSTSPTVFNKNRDGLYEGTLFIHNSILNHTTPLFLSFSTKEYEYKSVYIRPQLNQDQCNLSQKDFNITKIGVFKRYQRPIVLFSTSVIALLLVGLTIFTIAGGFKADPDENADRDSHVTPDRKKKVTGKMSHSEANEFLERVHNSLAKDDLPFEEIEKIYKEYLKNQEVLKGYEVLKEYKEDSCEMIEDYNKLVQFIKDGDYNSLGQITGSISGLCFSISRDHVTLVKNLDSVKFCQNYKEVNSLKELKEKCSKQEEATDVSKRPATQQCDRCLQVFKNLETHKKSCNHYACKICGKDMWFNSQEDLENHMNSKHGDGGRTAKPVNKNVGKPAQEGGLSEDEDL